MQTSTIATSIEKHLNHPAELERLYRTNKHGFKQALPAIAALYPNSLVLQCWQQRLLSGLVAPPTITPKHVAFMVVAALVAGLTAFLPTALHYSNAQQFGYFARYAAFIVTVPLSAYFLWKRKAGIRQAFVLLLVFALAVVYITAIPHNNFTGNTFMLSCLHLPLLLWMGVGLAYHPAVLHSNEHRLQYIQWSTQVTIVGGLLLISFFAISMLTVALFELIQVNFGNLLNNFLLYFTLPAIPIAATLVVQAYPQLLGRIVPVVAQIFSPLVLIMLFGYVLTLAISGVIPYHSREFLIIFNALLAGVLLLIFYSIFFSQAAKPYQVWILFLLAALALVINGIALASIGLRLHTWGITPNRLAVLGANLCMGMHLLLIAIQLYQVAEGRSTLTKVSIQMVRYLPVYALWVAIVTFLFPLLFGYS
ncbi:MAG TPA: hypothetical protein PKD90_11435 [Phnomibacter sp.]|nr:hypothetical protein [Phnomibacter sp.]